MIQALNILVAAVDGLIALPAAVVTVEIAAAMPAGRIGPRAGSPLARPPLAVLVPAHDEHDTIAATASLLKSQLRDGDRLLVVADNCVDDTAAIARAAGAEVIERQDAGRRGKGFALDFGVRHLAALAGGPPGVVVVVDADVRPSAGSLDRLAAQAVATDRPAQAVYLLRQAEAGPANPVSMLAFQVRNFVRPLGLNRLGGPCPLFGAGMAFPWAMIESAPLASPHLTEDVALALDLACRGHAPKLCANALIEGDSAPSAAASEKQRRRWEHGHLSLILSAAPRTFVHGLTRGSLQAVLLALDVMVPPLSFLVMLIGAATAVTWLLTLVGWTSLSLAIEQTCVLVIFTAALLTAAVRFGPAGQRTRLLGQIAQYAAGKVPMYAGFFFKRQKTWERTDRKASPAATPPTNGKHAA